MTTFFTSDNHFGHTNFCMREGFPRYGQFSSLWDMELHMINRWNEKVQTNDTVYHLGDLFCKASPGHAQEILNNLNGSIHLILGNHDKIFKQKTALHSRFLSIDHGYVEIPLESFGPHPLTLSHYKMQVWHNSHWGAPHLYGHCVDRLTEILTHSGWKNYANITEGDKIYSYNKLSGLLEDDLVLKKFVYPDYTGIVYDLRSRGLSMRLTDKHNVVYLTPDGNWRSEEASIALKRHRILLIRSGLYPSPGLTLSDDLLRLLIIINADGSLCNVDLIRIRVQRPRKVLHNRALLKRLGLHFQEHPQKDGSISFDFRLPTELKTFNLKGLDSKLLACTPDQFLIILDAYANSDGSRGPQYSNSTLIYTSKKEEVDLLQHLAFLNQHTSNCYERTGHGFSSQPSYQLTISPRTDASTDPRQHTQYGPIKGELFWCIETQNGNFVARRNGTTFLTGNSHQYELPCTGISLNVCVERWNYAPISEEEIVAALKVKEASWVCPIKKRGIDHF